jgi:hypothetical protein
MLKRASRLEAPKAGFPGITEVELREVHSLLLELSSGCHETEILCRRGDPLRFPRPLGLKGAREVRIFADVLAAGRTNS